jgi:hypothetical protein
MGRPINKKYFGVLGVDATPKIPVQAAGLPDKDVVAELGIADLYIVKQKNARRFLVRHTEDNSQGVCRLVDKILGVDDSTQIATGEMVIIGYTSTGVAKTIRSLTNRVATDFNGVRYKWSVSDDSTTSVLSLIAM